jgi:alkylation response protein AidB-like acyl-CoA dehydrogenase
LAWLISLSHATGATMRRWREFCGWMEDRVMDFELQPLTEPGRRLVAQAEDHAVRFATRADDNDREGRFSFENVEALKSAGYFAAPIPVECGGLGVESVHDVLVASSRLARGDASTTIGVNMHLNNAIRLALTWRRAMHAADHSRAAKAAAAMEEIAAGKVVVAAAITEAGRELAHPATTAVRNGAGWVVNGSKIFATMSPAATHLAVSVTYTADDGEERIAFARVPADTPGITVNEDWDALGMRASGSGSVTFQDVHVPYGAFGEDYLAGVWSAGLVERYLTAGPIHAAASLGVAESAAAQAVAFVSRAHKGRHGRALAERPALQLLAAENAVDLAAMRAVFGRAGMLLDRYFAAHPDAPGTPEVLQRTFAEVQSAKVFVHAAAIRIVDRALTLSGGAGYMNKHPLSRLYRDVRAGPFMHPLATPAAYEFIGRVTLGLEPLVA